MKVLTYFIHFTLLYCQLVNSKEWNGRTLKRFYQTNTGKINTQTNIEYQNGYRLPLRPAPVGPAPVVPAPVVPAPVVPAPVRPAPVRPAISTYQPTIRPVTGPYQGMHAKNVQVNGNVGYQRNKFNKKRFTQSNEGKINTQTNIEYQNGYRLPLRPAPVVPAPVVPAPVRPAISTYQPTIRPVTGPYQGTNAKNVQINNGYINNQANTEYKKRFYPIGPYQGIHAKNVQVNGNVGYQRNKFNKKRFEQRNPGKINTQTNIEYQNGYRLPLRPAPVVPAPVVPAPVRPAISTYQPTIRPVTGPYQGTNAKNVQINNGYINNQANTEYKKRFYPIGPYQGIHAKNVQVNGNVGYQRNKFNKKRFEQRNPGKINTQTNIEYQNGYRLPLRPAPVGPAPVVPAPVVPAPVVPAPVGPVISTYQPTIRPVTGPYQGMHAKNVQVNGNVGYQRNKFIKKRFTQLNAGHINTQINATEYSNDTNSTEKKSKRATKICDTKTQVFEDGNGGRVTLLGDRYKGLAEKWGLTKRGCETISNGKGIDITIAGDPYKQLTDEWINQAS